MFHVARSSSSWITSVATFPLISFPTTSSWEIPQFSTCPQTQPWRSSHAMLGSSAASRCTTVVASTGFFYNAWRTMSPTLRRSTSSVPFRWPFEPGHMKWSRKQFSTTSATARSVQQRSQSLMPVRNAHWIQKSSKTSSRKFGSSTITTQWTLGIYWTTQRSRSLLTHSMWTTSSRINSRNG